MNLADMLSYADIHDLGRIAGTYDCDCNGHSKNELIQSILSTVSRREIFNTEVESLSLEDLRFLNSLLFDRRDTFTLEELMARASQTGFQTEGNKAAKRNPRDAITRFKRRGWLFNGHSLQTKYLFQIPADLKRRFNETLTEQFLQKIESTGEPPVYRDEQQLILGDILQFLKYIFHQEAQLTAENYMYKRFLQQILDRMSVREEPAKGAWRFGYGRMFKEYPNRFSLIYDYCYFQELISEHNQVLSLTDKGKQFVLSGRTADLPDVYRFWLRLYKGAVPNLASLAHWVESLSKQWVTAESLAKIICPLIKPFYYDTPDSIFHQRLLQMMMHLGLLSIGEDEQQGKVVRINHLGSRIVRGTYVSDDEIIDLQI
jgi:hypothetical protein